MVSPQQSLFRECVFYWGKSKKMDKLLKINMLTQNSAHNVKNPTPPNCAQGDNLPLIKEFVGVFFQIFFKREITFEGEDVLRQSY